MINETIVWVISVGVVFLVSIYYVCWADREDSKTIINDINKEPVYMNGNIHKNVVRANDNILHNELVEILKFRLIKNEYCDRGYPHNTLADYEVILSYKNKSPKTIKYLRCTCKALNAVDDYISLEYKSSFTIKDTGPITTNKIGGGRWNRIYFNVVLTRKIEIISIEIEYMDKTKILIDKSGINDVMIDELN